MHKRNIKIVLTAVVVASVIVALAVRCGGKEGKPQGCPNECKVASATKLILDTDLGNSTDDMLAMQLAFAYQADNKCEVLGFMNSRQLHQAQDFADRMLHYYCADNVPLGVVNGDNQYFEIVPYYHLCESLSADGTPLYKGTGIRLDERLEAWKLYRKILAESADNSVSIVCVGMMTNLGLLMDSKADEFSPLSGMELIQRKVKQLDIMGCCFEKVPLRYEKGFLEVEYNVGGDVALAKHVLEDWPATLYITPLEAGLDFPSDHDRMLSDYSADTLHPMYQIYKNYDEWAKGDVGQYFWDPLCVIHSVEGDASFAVSARGKIRIEEDGHSVFEASDSGNVYIIGVGDGQKADISDKLMGVAGFRPSQGQLH